MEIALILLFGALAVGLLETRAIKKRREINAGIGFAMGQTGALKQTVIKSSVLAGGATATNIYDIYAVVDDHQQVLGVMEDRFNREMGDASPMEWFEKMKELPGKEAYISNYAGEVGERATVEMFQASGKRAEQFPSRTHENNDVRVFNEDGSYTDYSVKSMGDVSKFKNEVLEHPESTHYSVNSELYEKLEQTGELSKFSEKGIKIIDGGFSNEANRSVAEAAFEEVEQAGSFGNNIGPIAIGYFGYKVIKNVMKYSKGDQSGYETGVNIGGDVIQVGTVGLLATAGAEVGAAIGTAIMPGFGTIVGGGIGVLVGALSATSFISHLKEKVKWGDIITAIEAIGGHFIGGLGSRIKNNLKNSFLALVQVKKDLSQERRLRKKYASVLNPYSGKKVNLPAVLTHIHVNVLKSRVKQINRAENLIEPELFELCEKAAEKLSHGDEEMFQQYKKRYLGELLAANADSLLDGADMDEEMKELLQGYQKQIKKAPNHPYKFKVDSKDVVKGLSLRAYQQAGEDVDVGFFIINPLMFCMTLTMIVLGLSIMFNPSLLQFPLAEQLRVLSSFFR